MNIAQLILRSLRHYAKSNLAIAAGIAVSTAVICGALIVGESLSDSLVGMVQKRLGKTTHVLTAGDRIFSSSLAERLDSVSGFPCAPVLKTEAVVSTEGGEMKLNQVQVWGINAQFAPFFGVQPSSLALEDGEIQVSETVAKGLNLQVGDALTLRLKHVGPIPSNTPFVSTDQALITKRVVVAAILSANSYGVMNLASSQTQPLNVFVGLSWLNRATDNRDAANVLLIQSDKEYATEALQLACEKAMLPEDLNLNAAAHKGTLKLTSQRVFIESDITGAISERDATAEVFLTYFVNGLSLRGLRSSNGSQGLRGSNGLQGMNGFRDSKGSQGSETPYSFVSATNRYPDLKRGEVLINAWLAADLQAKVGDSISMRYFVFGSLRSLKEVERTFRIAGVVPMSVSASDSMLMPYLPGLSDAGNCRDWKTGIPVDLKKIRDKDEAYWNVYKGSPKAYMSLETGQEIWQNVYGNATNIFLKNEPDWKQFLNPFEQGFLLKPVLKEGLTAAESGVDFSQLFAGLGMFVIAAGLILTILLLNLSLKRRKDQIQLLNALGFAPARIRKMMLLELAFIAALGGLMGVLLSIVYSKLVFWGLNHLWYDMVRTDALILSFHFWTLVVGCLIGIVVGMLSVLPTLRRHIAALNGGKKSSVRGFFKQPKWWLTGLIVGGVVFGLLIGLKSWLPAGLVLLMGLLVAVVYVLNVKEAPDSSPMRVNRLIRRSIKRNAWGSFVAVVLLALGTFAIVVTAANKKNGVLNSDDPTTGTGGFESVAHTTIPILYDLNAPSVRAEYALPDSVRFVQFLSAYDDDASCLNLNVVSNPKILAADPADLQGRFTFVHVLPDLKLSDGWQVLADSLSVVSVSVNAVSVLSDSVSDVSVSDNVIPAVADQTVLEWGLGKKIGDTLHYVNVRGEKIHLLLVGSLASSVFQGHVLISKAAFLKHFHENGGSDFMLLDEMGAKNEAVMEDLDFALKEFGWNRMSTVQKLAEFNSIENTYLNVFFLMGAFAMLLGTIGLAIHLWSSLVDRKKETAVLKTLGFAPMTLFKMYAIEFFTLFISGTFIGLISAVVASFQTFLDGNQTIDLAFLLRVLLLLVLNGLFWIGLFAYKASKSLVSWKDLRND